MATIPFTSGGAMRQRVKIQSQSISVDASGGPVEEWTTSSSRWASVEPLKGQEKMIADQLQSQVTHKIKMRWFDGLSTKDRITLGSRTFQVQSINDVMERHRELQVMALEVGDG